MNLKQSPPEQIEKMACQQPDVDKLRDLRDRIIHMKTKDRDFRGEDGSSIWNALLSEPLPETHTTAKSIMKHFLDGKGKPPRWFEKCPFDFHET